MPNTLDKDNNKKGLFALFKGQSGSGKSVAALSFPNPYVFDFDYKMPAIALKHFPGKSIDYDTYNDLQPLMDKIKAWLYNTEQCPYETLIIDSFTGLCKLSVRGVAQIKGQTLPDILAQVKKAREGTKSKETITDWQDFDYYKAENRVSGWVMDSLKELHQRDGNPRHIIYTAHVVEVTHRSITDKVGNIFRSIVSEGVKVGEWLPTNFDETYFFTTKGGLNTNDANAVAHICITQNTGNDSAKTAYKLEREIDFTQPPCNSFYDVLMKQVRRTNVLESI